MAGEFNIEIEYRHVPRFESGSEESTRYLDEYGYVVIKNLSLIHNSEPTRRTTITYAVFFLKKK